MLSSVENVILPLSAAQREIWFAEQKLDPRNRVYKIGEYVEICGPVDPVSFETALRRVVCEADSLRVRIVERPEGPGQVVDAFLDWLLPVVDVSGEADPRKAALDWMTADVSRPMDLTRGPLFSYALIKSGADRFWWYQGYHHIVMDGFGLSLVARRVADVYTALAHGRPCEEKTFGSLRQLLDCDVIYRASERFTQDRAYWLDRFSDRPEPTGIAGRSSGAPESFVHQTAWLSQPDADRLRVTARRAKVPWSLIMIAATAVYVHRLTGAQDVVVDLPVTARQDPISESVPATVSNVLPLRLSVRPDMSLSRLLRQTMQEVREVLAHQRYRGEDLYRDLGLRSRIGTYFAPTINVMSFDYNLRFAGHRSTTHNVAGGLVDNLSIAIWDRKEESGLRLDWHAHPEVCSQHELAAHQRRFLVLLEAIAATDPDQPVGRIDILSTAERCQLLIDWNNTAVAVPPITLPELFEQQVTHTPDDTAVIDGDTTLTYTQLNTRANRLAHALIERGIGPEHIVALALPRAT
ncbi:MAG: condensation domain-containing protein, partial [Pseudonocardiaceae bacterium]